jgi:hypothetical protein
MRTWEMRTRFPVGRFVVGGERAEGDQGALGGGRADDAHALGFVACAGVDGFAWVVVSWREGRDEGRGGSTVVRAWGGLDFCDLRAGC